MPKRNAKDAAQTRADILVHAQDLFARQGYAATSAREISAAAGVTIGAMFHHFDSKLHVFQSVFEAMEMELDENARAASSPDLGLSVLETFLSGVRKSLDFAERSDFHRIVFVEAPAVLGQDKWREIDARLGLKTVMRGTQALMAAGVIDERPAKPMAILLMGAMNAAGFAIARGEESIDKDALVDALRALLIGPRPGNRKEPK
jgi:AcrR family transcriptional regulator